MRVARTDTPCWGLLYFGAGDGETALEVELWDAAAAGGSGAMLAAGTLKPSMAGWKEGSVQQEKLHLQPHDPFQVKSCNRQAAIGEDVRRRRWFLSHLSPFV